LLKKPNRQGSYLYSKRITLGFFEPKAFFLSICVFPNRFVFFPNPFGVSITVFHY
jgi:hypothetical protein